MYLCVTKGSGWWWLCEASILCKYDRRNGDLFLLSWSSVWSCALLSDAFYVLVESAVACISLFISLRVQPVAICGAVFCKVYSFVMFVVDAIGDYTVEAYSSSSIGLVVVLYVESNISLCLSWSIGIVLDALAAVFSMCRLFLIGADGSVVVVVRLVVSSLRAVVLPGFNSRLR